MKNKKVNFLLNQSGQAAIEYILLLIVMVSMLFAVKGVFTSMNTFMSDFMGGYVVCLMEYGELPSLGVQSAELKKHSTGSDGKKCEFRKFSSATAAIGGPGGGSGGGSRSGSSTSSDTKKTSPSSNSAAASEASRRSSGKSGKQGGDSPSDSRSGGSSSSSSSGDSKAQKGSPYTEGQINRGGPYATADRANSGNNKIKVLEDEGKKKDEESAGMSSRRRGKYNSSKYNAITGNMAQEIEMKSNKSARKPSSTVVQMSEEGYRFMPYKKTFTPPKTEKYIEEKKDEELGFGKFIKWLIIAGILIACFILFGGQIMNYSNSSD
jgi:hypothetical protein